jgi:hypothetical protein
MNFKGQGLKTGLHCLPVHPSCCCACTSVPPPGSAKRRADGRRAATLAAAAKRRKLGNGAAAAAALLEGGEEEGGSGELDEEMDGDEDDETLAAGPCELLQQGNASQAARVSACLHAQYCRLWHAACVWQETAILFLPPSSSVAAAPFASNSKPLPTACCAASGHAVRAGQGRAKGKAELHLTEADCLPYQ